MDFNLLYLYQIPRYEQFFKCTTYDIIEFWEKCRPISKIHNLQKWALCISIFNRFGTWVTDIIFLVILLVKFKSRHALPPGSCAESTREHEVRTAIAAAIVLLYGGKSAQQLSYGFNILDKLESCPHENQIPYKDMDFQKRFQK